MRERLVGLEMCVLLADSSGGYSRAGRPQSRRIDGELPTAIVYLRRCAGTVALFRFTQLLFYGCATVYVGSTTGRLTRFSGAPVALLPGGVIGTVDLSSFDLYPRKGLLEQLGGSTGLLVVTWVRRVPVLYLSFQYLSSVSFMFAHLVATATR